MEHRYNMDFMYNRTSRQQTIGSDSDSVDSIPELHDNLPYFYKKFIIIKNYGKGRYSKSKPCCILLLLFLLFLLLFGANFGLGYFLGTLFATPDPPSNSTAPPPTYLEANTSTLSVKYSLTVPKTIPDDEVKYKVVHELDKQLREANLPNNYYRYTIEDIVCTALKDANKRCEIKSELRFKQKVQFIDLEGALSLNDSDIADHVNNLILQENTMDINKIVEFFNKKPLKNLDIVVNDSSLTNLDKKELLSIVKDSGSIDYGTACENDADCSTNMICTQSINDATKRCHCSPTSVPIFSPKSGVFECKANVKLNYEDFCTSDSECFDNSICVKNRCACKPGLIFTRGVCVKATTEGVIQCKVDADCAVFTKLMKCVDKVCQCQMGYHLTNSLCVQGSVKINSACVTKWDCGENAVCGDDKICSCPAGFTSINEIDCTAAEITTTRLILQFLYQDVLKPPDEFDQIMFNVKNTYDQYLFNLSAQSTEFESYSKLQVEAYEYSAEKTQWSIRAVISFSQPIKLTQTLFDAVVEHLIQQKQFEVITKINSPQYKESVFVNYVAEIYLPKVQANKLIRDHCLVDTDCLDPNAQCVGVCNKPDCTQSPKICMCKNNYFESLNLFDNTIKCDLGQKLNDACDSINSPCGENMKCSAQGTCECLPGFGKTGSTCVPQKSLMPKVDGCVKNNDCPAFSKCQRGICICFTSYEVISGLCKRTYAKIFLVASESCLGQTFCGQNAACNVEVRTCKCKSNFQVIPPDNQICEPSCCG